ncbi:MAG: hypothetical protein WBP54_01755 [Pelodictyon phaeoclathratiforme]|jgi:hypothetical protein
MTVPWFDRETGILLLDELAETQPSFRKILEDGIITPEELLDQSNHVLELMQLLDKQLDDRQHQLVTELLSELAVLFAASQYHEIQQLKHQ